MAGTRDDRHDPPLPVGVSQRALLIGSSAHHCRILGHKGRGMMGVIEVH